jgi:hypothetical protein
VTGFKLLSNAITADAPAAFATIPDWEKKATLLAHENDYH